MDGKIAIIDQQLAAGIIFEWGLDIGW